MQPPPTPLAHATRALAVIFAAVFTLSAYWQLNDPDWLPWFTFYCASAVAALAAPWTTRGWMLAAALCVGAVLWGAVIASAGLDPITWEELTGDLSMKTLNVERHREIGGLGIVSLALAALAIAGANAPTAPRAPLPPERPPPAARS